MHLATLLLNLSNMKKFCLPFYCLIVLMACKKQINSTKSVEQLPAQPPCSPASWTATPNYTLGYGFDRFAFVYNNKVYIPEGYNDVHVYDGSGWSVIDSYSPYSYYNAGFCFTIGDKGYLSQGGINAGKKLWEYSITDNVWTEKTEFPGDARFFASSFVIDGKAYIAGGRSSSNYNFLRDVWQYDPVTDSWAQKANIPLTIIARAGATGFSIGSKGYIACGYHKPAGVATNIFFRDLIEYNSSTDTWILKSTFPGQARAHTSIFVINNVAYIGGGGQDNIGLSNQYKDFYKYYSSTNSWGTIIDFPSNNPTSLGYAINNRGYVIGYMGNYKYTAPNCYIISPNQ